MPKGYSSPIKPLQLRVTQSFLHILRESFNDLSDLIIQPPNAASEVFIICKVFTALMVAIAQAMTGIETAPPMFKALSKFSFSPLSPPRFD